LNRIGFIRQPEGRKTAREKAREVFEQAPKNEYLVPAQQGGTVEPPYVHGATDYTWYPWTHWDFPRTRS
jgi:hypothetical protein